MQLTAEQQKAIDEQKEHCPFCKIVKGDIPATKVYEDDLFLAVLDINPGSRGHTLLLPKEHYPIMPLIPAATLARLAVLVGNMSRALRTSMVAPRVDAFIANGAAAGQQSSHFLIHILPGDEARFALPSGETDKTKQLEKLLRARFGTSKDMLSTAIAQNPELKRMIIEQPDELIKSLPRVPDLQKLFEGVDIHKLSEKLREQDNPPAHKMNDEELVAFINAKQKLRELLINDPASLEKAAQEQEKLKLFFKGTTVASVRERYLRGSTHV